MEADRNGAANRVSLSRGMQPDGTKRTMHPYARVRSMPTPGCVITRSARQALQKVQAAALDEKASKDSKRVGQRFEKCILREQSRACPPPRLPGA